MLKICKNMQNIQNMHSCFKNAALCRTWERAPWDTGVSRGLPGWGARGVQKRDFCLIKIGIVYRILIGFLFDFNKGVIYIYI